MVTFRKVRYLHDTPYRRGCQMFLSARECILLANCSVAQRLYKRRITADYQGATGLHRNAAAGFRRDCHALCQWSVSCRQTCSAIVLFALVLAPRSIELLHLLIKFRLLDGDPTQLGLLSGWAPAAAIAVAPAVSTIVPTTFPLCKTNYQNRPSLKLSRKLIWRWVKPAA